MQPSRGYSGESSTPADDRQLSDNIRIADHNHPLPPHELLQREERGSIASIKAVEVTAAFVMPPAAYSGAGG